MLDNNASPEEILAQFEGQVRNLSYRFRRYWLPAEDIAQELRLQVLQLARSFDPAKYESLEVFIGFNLKRRAVDVVRKAVGKKGERLPVVAMFHRDGSDEDGPPLDRAVEDDRLAEADWVDLRESTRGESKRLRSLLDRMEGQMVETIAERYGVSHSTITLWTTEKHYDASIERLATLIGVA